MDNLISERGSEDLSGGIGICSVLTIVFIVLKLTGNIDWSWWWVISPLWITLLLIVFLIFVALIVSVFSKE